MSDEKPDYWAGQSTATGIYKNWYMRDKAGRTYICYQDPVNRDHYRILLHEGTFQPKEWVLTSGDLRLLRDLLNYIGGDAE